ncbi:Armadillo-type fold,Armadillo-like helical,Alpha/Beta hydrolase fold [Cinara cedri]|uniref:Protein SERAC1 n=1 Tax=Cinara cedri TaxID=506608 RepID=A0A5E4M3R8_9HEMI|nr:Armadillo-type fold,Armadillo-like helical,Alpha/Beta hydrolase fold [Cinara cedri]
MTFSEFRKTMYYLPKFVLTNRKRIRLVAESITFCVVTSSLGWLGYEIRELITSIENSVQKDPMLLNNKAPEYVFVDKPMFTELDEYQIIDSNSIIQPTNPPVFFLQIWNDFKHKTAWKLLEMANKSKNSKIALAATQKLTSMVHLKDSDFQHLAQMSQPHTLVGLARSANVNPKFFLPPRNMSWTKDEILYKVRNLLIKLNELTEHKCLSYFIAYAFKNKQLDYYQPEDIPPDFRSMHIDNDNILQLSINALCHHCNNEKNVTAMVKLGGLQILMALYQYLQHDEEVAEEIGKLLSVASLNKDLTQDICVTGWISILFKWKNHQNFRIQSWANRTLLNMDNEDPINGNYKFGKQTVLLYPKDRSHQDATIDVVLVHGLLGGVSFSWREKDLFINEPLGLFDMSSKTDTYSTSNTITQKRPVDENMQDYIDIYKEVKAREWNLVGKEFEFVLNDIPIKENTKGNGIYSLNGTDSAIRQIAMNKSYSQCWPSDWLPTDIDGLRVIGVDYSTTLSEWLPSCPLKQKRHRTLEGRTDKLMIQLLTIGIGDRPIIFLAHSMGGLLVKNMLVTARNSDDPNVRKLFEKTRSVFFFSTPHHGSPLATLNSAYRFFLWPSVEVDELRTDSPKLVSLHQQFLECVQENPMKIVTFVETCPTEFTALKVPILCVPKDAADPSIGELYELPLNHMSICKADSKLSFVYQKTLSVIKTIAAYSS